MNIAPIEIIGNWKKGYALDYNAKKIVYKKDNIFGYPEFDTCATEIGKALYEFKEFNDQSKGDEIAKCASEFLKNTWKISEKIDGIIAVPTAEDWSNQPLYMLVKKIGYILDIPVSADFFAKLGPKEIMMLSNEEKLDMSKNIFRREKKLKNRGNILLIDDFYNTGTTLKAITMLLREDVETDDIYVMSIIKNRHVE